MKNDDQQYTPDNNEGSEPLLGDVTPKRRNSLIATIAIVVLILIVVGAVIFYMTNIHAPDDLETLEHDIEDIDIDALHKEFEEHEEEFRSTLNE